MVVLLGAHRCNPSAYVWHADFSDAVTAAKLQRISAQSSELVSFAARDRPFESPMERYSRLKSELQQFEEDMKELAKVCDLNRYWSCSNTSSLTHRSIPPSERQT